MEDRIYRSLRTAQERELHNHAVPAEPAAAHASAAAPAAPEHAAPPTHVAAPAHAAAPAHVPAPPHAHVQPVDAAGPRWFTRGLGGERPRISVVGTLSLSVLISAGLFAAQRIFNPPQKHHDDIVAADSSASLRLAAHTPDDADDDSTAPVSVSRHVRNVHAPGAHVHSRSARAVASDDQSSDESLLSDATESTRPPNRITMPVARCSTPRTKPTLCRPTSMERRRPRTARRMHRSTR